jgi:hypothetical protein
MNYDVALEKYSKGIAPSVSTFIDEDTILLGYGELDYDFEFPLPKNIIIKEYGTTSWNEYFKLKGLNKYLITNLETEEQSISPYLSERDLIESMMINEGFKYELID